MNKYLVGGIVLETEIDFPELVSSDSSQVDVVVRYGEVPEELEDTKQHKMLFSSNDKDEVLFKMPDVARFLIKGTSEVIIDIDDAERRADAHKYILTFVLGILSFKKKFYPLHGGGIVYNGEAYLFSGKSGAGKSTTMAGLQQRGFPSVGDDIANMFIKDGKAYVHPCFPRFKLWEQSLKILDNKNKGEYLLRSDMDKYLVPVDNFHTTPVPVKRIYLLEENLVGETSFTTVTGKEKLMKLKANSYKPWMVDAFGLTKTHFGLMMQISPSVEFIEFSRPKNEDKIESMFSTLISHIKGE
jgi:hypothetical protein